ncbi:hypothetical protein SAMN05216369_0547 [Marinobacter antarcticus]|uniref:Uncharacterized protein n=1 Tax=Marinobacter antarcticus TaxID=564117 RepID=A0A1M6PWF8_9GAMM|nr:hypothetical protein SAMN05216369_0547 [Marinobacter antarcticus]
MKFNVIRLCRATVLPTLFNETDKSETQGERQSEQ